MTYLIKKRHRNYLMTNCTATIVAFIYDLLQFHLTYRAANHHDMRVIERPPIQVHRGVWCTTMPLNIQPHPVYDKLPFPMKFQIHPSSRRRQEPTPSRNPLTSENSHLEHEIERISERNWLTFSGYEHLKCSIQYCHTILSCHQVNKL